MCMACDVVIWPPHTTMHSSPITRSDKMASKLREHVTGHYRPFGLRMTGPMVVMSHRLLVEHIYFRPEISIQSTSFVNACFPAMHTTSTFLVETLHGISTFWNVATEDLSCTISTKQSVHCSNAFPLWWANHAQQKTLVESTANTSACVIF